MIFNSFSGSRSDNLKNCSFEPPKALFSAENPWVHHGLKLLQKNVYGCLFIGNICMNSTFLEFLSLCHCCVPVVVFFVLIFYCWLLRKTQTIRWMIQFIPVQSFVFVIIAVSKRRMKKAIAIVFVHQTKPFDIDLWKVIWMFRAPLW